MAQADRIRQQECSRAEPEQRRLSQDLYDVRFRRLLGDEGWARLPEAVRARFSKRLGARDVAVYRGCVIECRHSRIGWMLAQLARLFGGPLPLYADRDVPSVVMVSEDAASGGQCWTRVYARKNGFPQVIHSAKRFSGETGLEEYLGWNLGMALNVEARDDGLVFTSDHYFLMLGSARFRLPRWLAPGQTTVSHCDIGDGKFIFELELHHSLLGELVHQVGEFRDD